MTTRTELPSDRNRRPLRLAALGAAACLLLAGCGGGAGGPQAHERVVSVYNWADFIGKTTVADFEAATGIKVDYDTFDSDQTLEAKLLAGGSGYDVVSTATNYFSRQIRAGAYRKLDRAKLTGWANLDPKALALMATADPGNQYAVPYMHAINGYSYNVEMVRQRMPDAPVDSLDLIFKPENIRRFADCGVTFLDSAEDVLQLALVYLHLDPNTVRAEDYAAAEALILKVRPYIKTFDSVEYLNSLANQETCIAMSWSSDYAVSMARMRAAGVDVKLAFTVPKEGANATYSAMLIPVDAPHVAEAHEFLNFLLRPEVIAMITNETHYANENLAASRFVEPAILNDPTLYMTPEIAQRLYLTSEVSAATERVRTRIWTRIKTAH
jgi:putrescine transport system substrate-binding protein